MLTFVAAFMLAFLAQIVVAQDFTAIQNVTSLEGTWSSGSGGVLTGLGFYNPITKNFTMPPTAGISYSFTNDGFFETAQFVYTPNPKTNRCFTAALSWQHGKYTINANNSLSLQPYPADGYVQVISPCAGETVKNYYYNQFELVPQWTIYTDAHPGFQSGGSAYALMMYNDGGDGQPGAPKNIMWLKQRPPVMLPTEQLYQEVLNPTT